MAKAFPKFFISSSPFALVTGKKFVRLFLAGSLPVEVPFVADVGVGGRALPIDCKAISGLESGLLPLSILEFSGSWAVYKFCTSFRSVNQNCRKESLSLSLLSR